MTLEESIRYKRQIILPEFGIEKQEKLSSSSVLVIGAGGLGSPVLFYLASTGVGTIGIIDDDVVDVSNLQRQILYDSQSIGEYKVEKAAEKIKALNPFVKVDIFKLRLNSENAENIFLSYDLIIDGSDNFETRYLVNDTCIRLNKPWVFGSIYKFEGQISVFNYKNGPSYRCLFPEPPIDGDMPNCSEIGVIGVLPGIIGTLQANEAIKILANFGETLSGKLYTFNALTLVSSTIRFKKIEYNFDINNLKPIQMVCNSNPTEIDVYELKNWMDTKKEFVLIDVRENWEYDIANIGGLNITLANLSAKNQIFDNKLPKVILCHHGIRSLHAINYLKNAGVINLINLKGGINQWSLKINQEIEQY